MSELKLEAGKFYRTRCRAKAKLLEQMGNKWFGAVFSGGDLWLAGQWHLSGEYDPVAGKCSMDLISEWNDDDEWEDVDPSKITLSMLPMVARFKAERDSDWHHAELRGIDGKFGKYFLSTNNCWWQQCQIRKEEK